MDTTTAPMSARWVRSRIFLPPPEAAPVAILRTIMGLVTIVKN
jgi:hypothetical protein